MAIVSGYQKMKDYIKQSSGYKLISRWANANTLECDDGKTLQSKVGGISGISSSLTANSTTQAASTNLTNQLYQNIVDVKQSFQDGCRTIASKLTSCGVTTSNTASPSTIANNIQTLYTNRYNSGRTQGQNDVKNSPNSYGLYSKSQYDQNYSNGYNTGISAASIQSVTDITSKLTSYASQNHGFRSNVSLAEYKYIVAAATYQSGKTAYFSNFSGCSCFAQVSWAAHGATTAQEVATHLIILKDITGPINVWANSTGTGNKAVFAFGLK